jgi:radical SAM protein with 4Fe4S-binding SPASM domain
MTRYSPPVVDLKPATALPLADDLAMPLTQFDLANVTASSIDFLRNQGRALQADCGLCTAKRICIGECERSVGANRSGSFLLERDFGCCIGAAYVI